MEFKKLQDIFKNKLKGVTPVITKDMISIPVDKMDSNFELTPVDGSTLNFTFAHKTKGRVSHMIRLNDGEKVEKLLSALNGVTVLVLPPGKKIVKQNEVNSAHSRALEAVNNLTVCLQEFLVK
jgi:hypothetical protein